MTHLLGIRGRGGRTALAVALLTLLMAGRSVAADWPIPTPPPENPPPGVENPPGGNPNPPPPTEEPPPPPTEEPPQEPPGGGEPPPGGENPPPVHESPEPASVVLGLIGAGAGLASWRKKRLAA
jgi:hypothetical protein